MMYWKITKRNDWKDGSCTTRWVVHKEGEERGICECWNEGDAERIAAALTHCNDKGEIDVDGRS